MQHRPVYTTLRTRTKYSLAPTEHRRRTKNETAQRLRSSLKKKSTRTQCLSKGNPSINTYYTQLCKILLFVKAASLLLDLIDLAPERGWKIPACLRCPIKVVMRSWESICRIGWIGLDSPVCCCCCCCKCSSDPKRSRRKACLSGDCNLTI